MVERERERERKRERVYDVVEMKAKSMVDLVGINVFLWREWIALCGRNGRGMNEVVVC